MISQVKFNFIVVGIWEDIGSDICGIVMEIAH